MDYPCIINDRLHTPFCIFVRSGNAYADRDLLRLVGMPHYRPIQPEQRIRHHVTMANLGEWAMVADDWFYTLWHMETKPEILARLGKLHETFACSVGDCDDSYDFEYHRAGRCVRRYVIDSPSYNDQVVREDFGNPLSAERTAFQLEDLWNRVMAIAESLGIRTQVKAEELRLYGPGDTQSR